MVIIRGEGTTIRTLRRHGMTIAASHRTATRLHVGRLVDGTAAEPVADAALLVIDGADPEAIVARWPGLNI